MQLPFTSTMKIRVELFEFVKPGLKPKPVAIEEVEFTGAEIEFYTDIYAQDFILSPSLHMLAYGGNFNWLTHWSERIFSSLLAREAYSRPPPYYKYHTESVCKALGEGLTALVLNKLGVSKILRLAGAGSLWKPAAADFIIDVSESKLEELYKNLDEKTFLVETRAYVFPREKWIKTEAKIRNQVAVFKTANDLPIPLLSAIAYLSETPSFTRKLILCLSR